MCDNCVSKFTSPSQSRDNYMGAPKRKCMQTNNEKTQYTTTSSILLYFLCIFVSLALIFFSLVGLIKDKQVFQGHVHGHKQFRIRDFFRIRRVVECICVSSGYITHQLSNSLLIYSFVHLICVRFTCLMCIHMVREALYRVFVVWLKQCAEKPTTTTTTTITTRRKEMNTQSHYRNPFRTFHSYQSIQF